MVFPVVPMILFHILQQHCDLLMQHLLCMTFIEDTQRCLSKKKCLCEIYNGTLLAKPGVTKTKQSRSIWCLPLILVA